MLSVSKPTSLVQQKKQQWARERGAYSSRGVEGATREPVHARAAASRSLAVLQLIHGRGFVKEFYVHSRLRDTFGIYTTRVLLKLERILYLHITQNNDGT